MTTPYVPGTKKARLFALLKSRRWQHVRDLAKAGGFRFGARLEELRVDGHTIKVKRDPKKPNLFHYRLVS
jgi:hypothetical protein